MDQTTATVWLAGIAAVVTLGNAAIAAYILRRANQTHALVNGMAHEKDDLVARAARAEGEMRGRDYVESRQNPPTSPASPDVRERV